MLSGHNQILTLKFCVLNPVRCYVTGEAQTEDRSCDELKLVGIICHPWRGMSMQWSVGWKEPVDEKRETHPSAMLFTTNPIQDALVLNLSLHSEEPVSSHSHLYHGQSNQYILDSIPCIPILTSYFPHVLLKITTHVSLWQEVSPVKLCTFRPVVIHIVHRSL